MLYRFWRPPALRLSFCTSGLVVFPVSSPRPLGEGEASGAISLRYLGAIPGYWVRGYGPPLEHAVCGGGGYSVSTRSPIAVKSGGGADQRDSPLTLSLWERACPPPPP